MKKKLLYTLGVMNIFCGYNLAFAVEKFEILPDLPESLAYTGQSAQAASVSGAADLALGSQSVGNDFSIIAVVLSLLFVITLIYLSGVVYSRLNKLNSKVLKKQGGAFSHSQVSVLSTTHLGNQKSLHVVELDGKRMLIGASQGSIQLIKDLGKPQELELSDEYSHIEIPNIKIPKIEIPKIEIPTINFSKLMTKTHKPMSDVEKNEVVDNDNEIKTKNDTQEKENSEVIIDSLFSPSEVIVANEDVSAIADEHKVDPEDFALYKKYLNI